MPNYYNPYNFYPVGYANQMGYSGMQMPQAQPVMQQSQAMQPQIKAMEWVEGEVGAKAFQMPQNWPANQPIPLWDSTDTIIWLKSWGPMGIPNPMQKLKYEMPEQQQSQALLMNGQSGAQEPQQLPDMSNFATKDDINMLREEVRQMRMPNQNQSRTGYSGNVQQNQQTNQNGSQNGNQNRGGNQ
jgi:hypothetical protein